MKKLFVFLSILIFSCSLAYAGDMDELGILGIHEFDGNAATYDVTVIYKD